jgi:alpha 1,6-mannosyltransferase
MTLHRSIDDKEVPDYPSEPFPFTYEKSIGRDTLARNHHLTLQRLSFIGRREIKSNIIKRAYAAINKPWDGNIPKLIHQTDRSPYGFMTSRSIATFRLRNRDYTHLFWKDDDIITFVQIFFPNYSELFNQIPRLILKLDIFRYMLLYIFGGTYSDTDTYCLKPISTWTRTYKSLVGMIIAIEADQPDYINRGWARNFQFVQWTICMTPGYHLMYDIISACQDKIKNHQGNISNNDVMELTGPGIFTDIIMQYINNEGFARDDFRQLSTMKLVGDLLILPVTGFQAVDQAQFGSKPEKHPDSFVRHRFRGSWHRER